LCGRTHALLVQPRQVGVELRHHRCPFADGAPDALDRATAYVADGEHTGHARLQRPGDVFAARADQLLEREVRPRLHETLPIEHALAAPKPLRRRIGADEEEDVTDVRLRLGPGLVVLPADLLQLTSIVGL